MKFLEEIEGVVLGHVHVIKTVFSLVKLEARLAGLSVFPLLLNVCFLFVVLLSLWFLGMALLVYAFMDVFGSILLALAAVLLLNVLLLVLLLIYLLFNLKKMSFEKTRDYFFNKRTSEHVDQLKKTSDS